MNFLKAGALIIAILASTIGYSQDTYLVDSLKRELAKPISDARRVDLLGSISKLLMNTDMKAANEYGLQQIAFAESTRNRKLMFKAYHINGERTSNLAMQKDNYEKTLSYYNQAKELAQKNKLDEELGMVHLSLAELATQKPDNDLALQHATQASSILLNGKNDSLKAVAYYTLGNVHLHRREKTLALRNFFYSVRIAENLKNYGLQKNCYTLLSGFYGSIEDYDKAIDYANLAYQVNEKIQTKNSQLISVNLLNRLSELYAAKKNYDLAIKFANLSIKRADSINYPPLKVNGYFSLMNQYLTKNEPAKAYEFFNSPQGADLKQYFNNKGLSSSVDIAYAIIFTEMGKYDSAAYYYNKAKSMLENSPNAYMRIYYFSQYAKFLKKSGKAGDAIKNYETVIALATQNNMLEMARNAAAELDTLYTKTGNYSAANASKDLYYKYKDSVYTINREKELSVLEANDEQARQTMLDKEKEDAKRRRNNIQYLAITLGIVVLFIALVVLGMFKVSRGVIKALGFFAFLMMFEFLFLLFKKNIYGITHGEPWKDLLAMIALAAILVPLHHWLEHRVLHLLTSQNRLTNTGSLLKSKLSRTQKV